MPSCSAHIQYTILNCPRGLLIYLMCLLLPILSSSVSGHEGKKLELIETGHIESLLSHDLYMQKSIDRIFNHGVRIAAFQALRFAGALSGIAKGATSGNGKPRKKRNLVYATVDGRPLNLDLFIPDESGPHPLIVWIHGGGWQRGDKNLKPAHPARQQVRRGYAVASIEYRLSDQANFPAQIHDCKAAIRWLRGNAQRFDLDPNRFAVWGLSAGGHLSALLGTSGDVAELEDLSMGYANVSSRVQAVVDWYGPTDFSKMGGKHDQQTSPESLLIGCPIQSCPQKTAKANPINYISLDDPPFFIQHGTWDEAVPYRQSELLYKALKNKGIRSTFIPLEKAKHTDPRFSTPNNVALVEEFLDKVLRN